MSTWADGLNARFRHLLPLPFIALKESLRDGYNAAWLRTDIIAGISVGIIALPLAMALAVASGVAPQYGLYTSIIAGAVIALLGGSRVSVSGPTAAFVVLLAPISSQYGLGGLVICTFIAGLILCIMGAAGLGKLIQFIPHPVTTGFTAGIGVVIGTLQIKDFLGMKAGAYPQEYIEKIIFLAKSVAVINWADAVVGATTLTVLIIVSKYFRRIPPALAASLFGALLGVALVHFVPGAQVDTLRSRFTYTINGVTGHGIPPVLPGMSLPWNFPGADGKPLGLSYSVLRELLSPALAIALLGAIESLLCAVAADGMAGTKHNPDAELLAQGTGNLLCSLFGGFAATGAIARTAANIRAGARSPIASIVHSIFILLALLCLSSLLGYLPMATLAALLLMVAWNMSDARHFIHTVRVAPKSDIAVLLTCFSLTVLFDMVIAVTVGVVLAAILFMRRMAELTHTRVMRETHELSAVDVPSDVLVYEIAGPLFFGAAEKVLAALTSVQALAGKRALILNMHGVPALDITGLVALESLLKTTSKTGLLVILAGVGEQPRRIMARGGIVSEPGKLAFSHDLEQAIMLASLK